MLNNGAKQPTPSLSVSEANNTNEVKRMLHKTKVKCHRGDIFFCEFPDVVVSVQNGCRPALVIQNDIGNKNSSTTIVSPITSVIKRKDLPTHIILEKQCGLEERSMVMLEQIITVDKDVHLKEYVGTIPIRILLKRLWLRKNSRIIRLWMYYRFSC